jgi:hypothetical protein
VLHATAAALQKMAVSLELRRFDKIFTIRG